MNRLASRRLLVLGLFTAMLGGLTAGSATAADGPQRIVNDHTGGSLTPYYRGLSANDNIRISTYDTSRANGGDQWEFEAADGGSVVIRNTKTRKCLKPGRHIGRTGKATVVQWTCNDTPEFQWRLTPARYGTYEITSVSTRQVLAPDRGYRNHEWVVLEPDMNIAKQRWSITSLH